MTIFETPRLRVRPLAPSDFPQLYRLLSDPETMRYIRAPFTHETQARERIAVWEDYNEKCPGLGVFVIESKENSIFMGFCVARHVEYNPANSEYEVGYVFAPEARRQGLASELLPHLCRYGFDRSYAQRLVAFTHPDNEISQRVLLKSGFSFAGKRTTPDGESNEYWLPLHP